ncbi:hypothetical protein GCM10025857_21290 [Alicyclobacillus contaminans]|nr:hypothetical protein GCM10025857_21290 [Alicyclobacillus contaminans]
MLALVEVSRVQQFNRFRRRVLGHEHCTKDMALRLQMLRRQRDSGIGYGHGRTGKQVYPIHGLTPSSRSPSVVPCIDVPWNGYSAETNTWMVAVTSGCSLT